MQGQDMRLLTSGIAEQVAPGGLVAQRGRITELQRHAAPDGRGERGRPQPERQPPRQVEGDQVHIQ